MNRFLRWSFLSAVLLSVGCVRENPMEQLPETSDGIEIRISGEIDQIPTRATAAGFVDGDALGLYAVNYSADNTVAGTLADSGNQADNVQYVFDEGAQKWNPLKPVYYKDANTNVDLYVYYPYQSSIGSVHAYSFEVQKDQSRAQTQTALSGYEASDLLWGKAENVPPSENKVTVTLKHRLANVIVTLKEGTGFAEGEFPLLEKTVLATGTTRKASVDFAEGTVTPVGAAQMDGIVMAPQEDGSFRAVVIPQTIAASTPLLSITVAGMSYGFRRDADVTYAAGKMTKFTVSVSRKTPSGDYEFTLTDMEILPWTEDRNTHGGEARQYYVVNVTEPGTLGRLIKADKKNPDKIRNLKVTGTVTTEDFWFMRDSMAILEAVNMKESRVVNAKAKDEGWWDDPVEYHEPVFRDDVIPSHAFYDKKSLFYFVFPERVTGIGMNAFAKTNLSGHLTLPVDVVEIDEGAFSYTNISGITFNDKLEIIENDVFAYCSSCTGNLLLPPSLKSIGGGAFRDSRFSGQLVFPPNLEYIGDYAFYFSGTFSGDLFIPDKIRTIKGWTFWGSSFSGHLDLNNVVEIDHGAFFSCGFSGQLVLNDDITIIPADAFSGNHFIDLRLPASLKRIDYGAFAFNLFMEPIIFPEGCVIIGEGAFSSCPFIPEVVFPSTLQTIQSGAFSNCIGIVRMTSNAIEAPQAFPGAFDGVGKDNLTLEVPAQSITRYQTSDGWSDFKRISAHYDFSLSRRMYRALNASSSRRLLLRVPSGHDWSIESKPDWVSVSPDHGTGNAEVTVTVSEMPRTSETFDSEYWKNGAYQETQTYTGRSGEVVFLLNEKDYRFTLAVEQYDYEYGDGESIQLQAASRGDGIDLVFLGDGYDARDIADGTYLQNVQEAISHFFAVEPYATYKDYFSAHIVFARSEESGLEGINTIVENKFGSYLPARLAVQRLDDAFTYAKKAPIGPLNESLVVLLVNSSVYEGITYMYSDGSALAACPVSTHAYPFDFRGIVQHEAGGHGFGKLGDEYIYHNTYIEACPYCVGDMSVPVRYAKSLGWYRNLELTGDWNQVGWSHLIFHPAYSDMVDVYEGGFMHARHIWRSEPTSCMNNNIPYFSAISRQAIVERIMDYAGETFTLDKFYTQDKRTVGPATRSGMDISEYTLPDIPFPGHRHGPVILDGSPNVK